jgi:hypothetical protein
MTTLAAVRTIAAALAAGALLCACTELQNRTKFAHAQEITTQLDQHPEVLRHTPAGGYSYRADTSATGKVTLTIAGVTNRDDQNGLLQVLRNLQMDKQGDWNAIRVLFYEKTVPAPETPAGVTYVNLLRQETIY